MTINSSFSGIESGNCSSKVSSFSYNWSNLLISSFIMYQSELKSVLCNLIFTSSLEISIDTGIWLWYTKAICFLFEQCSLAYRLSTTSSNSDTADGACLLTTKLILASFASLTLAGGTILTNNDKGNWTSACDVLNWPAYCWRSSESY